MTCFRTGIECGEEKTVFGLYRKVKKTAFRIAIGLKARAGYIVKKAYYRSVEIRGNGVRSKTDVKLSGYVPVYSLELFLSRPKSELDAWMQQDLPLLNQIVQEGERVYRNEWLVLNAHRANMYDPASGHYRWTEDFFTGYTYQPCFFLDARKQKTFPGTDIKIPWEVARMQSLFALALAYRATKQEKYAERVKEIIRDFNQCCPCGQGVNWNVSMEVGIRIANILLACELIEDSPQFDEAFRLELAATVYEHMTHIRKNLEKPSDGTNHLIADLLGIAVTSAAMPLLPGARRYAAFVQKMLRKELMRQVLPDGGNFEGSVSYHRLVGEMLCFAVLAQKRLGFALTEEENTRLALMGQFTAALRMTDGLVPQFGDTDSGRVFQWIPEHTRDHDSFVNLVSYVTRNTLVYPGKSDGFFVFYNTNARCIGAIAPQRTVWNFPKSKLLLYRKDEAFLAFSGMTADTFGKAGHSHNDVLSFVFSLEEEFITDSGSGEYTGNREINFAMRSVKSHSTMSVDEEEQRIPPEDHRVFIWNTSVRSGLKVEDGEGGVCLFGECSYRGTNGKAIQQRRRITILSASLTVEDELEGMDKVCSMTLPVHPGIDIETEAGGVVLTGKNHRLRISGTYAFEIIPSVFAEQYKKIVPNRSIRCVSQVPSNELRIEWMRCNES